ncbi:MAG TPA: DPP IV N-terminal domain-containing protein [Bacteroidales bacterium]|nr:DPP IV N-terminal domain-containing protein [Bacteroidales bacterium]
MNTKKIFNKIYQLKIQSLIVLCIILLLFCTNVFSQNKYLKLEDPFINPNVYPEYLENIIWCDNTNFTWVSNDTLLSENINTNKIQTIITLKELNNLLEAIQEPTVKYFLTIEWADPNTFFFTNEKKIYTYNKNSKKIEIITSLDKDAENIDIHNKTLKVAFTIGNNLFIADKNNIKQITFDNITGIVNGKSVHREEFGITKGTFWSPLANYLAFYRMDETMVTDYPLVKINSTPAKLYNIKYPMAGMTSHQVTIGVYNCKTNKTIFLKTGTPVDQYLTNISWSPDEKYILVAIVNREQNYYKLNKYDANTGEFISKLFEEQNDKYVEPLHPAYFINNTHDFIWLSRKDGFTHAYLYNANNNSLKQITTGKWEIDDIIGFDKNNQIAYFTANKDNIIGKDIYSVNIKNKLITRISNINGYHEPLFSPDFKYVIDQFSNSKDIVNRYDLLTSSGKYIKTLLNSKNPLKEYDLGETSIFTLKAEDGTDLYCRLIKPANMLPDKKYPVLYYVYGGPHSQLVADKWLGNANLFFNYMAQQGYVIFTMDNRGTSRRGANFEQAIFRNLGNVEIKDQLIGVEYLKKQPYVDTTRLGIHGWSYGGFMTLMMMLKHPGLFKVAIAGGPVTHWKYYEVMYGERYMDTPQENPQGYENANVMNYAKNLNGKLLLIHGAMDSTVVWQHTLVLLQKFIEEGKIVDYFIYPEQAHNIRGKTVLHLYKKIEQYFKENL